MGRHSQFTDDMDDLYRLAGAILGVAEELDVQDRIDIIGRTPAGTFAPKVRAWDTEPST